jgi:hypothetical protein
MVHAVGICKTGIIDYSHTLCCAKSCGVCGGYGCETRPGGATACCANPIKATMRVCRSDSDVHCVIQAHPKCESGILSADNRVCCSKTCGVCAGGGCEKRPGGANNCCLTVIMPTKKMCTSPGQTACVMPPLLALAENSDSNWHVIDLNVAGVLASAMFMVVGLVSLAVSVKRRYGAAADPDPLLNAEYSLIKGETTM